MTSAVFNCYTIPYKVAYEPPMFDTPFFELLNYIIDIVFLIDIIINFRTAYIDDKGNEVDVPIKIAGNYLSRQFWIDLVATIPID